MFLDSQYFRTLVELGVIGLVAFLWLTWSALKIGKHSYVHGKSEYSRGLSLGYMAGLVALMVHGIGSTTFIIIRIMEPFWLLTAIVMLYPTLEEVEEEVDEEMKEEQQAIRPGLGRTSSARVLAEKRVLRARDLVRSHLKDERW